MGREEQRRGREETGRRGRAMVGMKTGNRYQKGEKKNRRDGKDRRMERHW